MARETEYTVRNGSRAGQTILEWELETADDVTEDVIEKVWGVVEGWYMDEPIDWEDVLNRAEGWLEGAGPDGRNISFGSQMDTPAIRKVQREVRALKRES